MKLHEVDPHTPFKSGEGKPIATLRFSPEEVAQHYGLRFAEMADDFDSFQIAAVILDNGLLVRFMRYAHDPGPGTIVYADANADIEDAQWLLRRTLNLSEQDFLWRAQPEEQRHAVGV